MDAKTTRFVSLTALSLYCVTVAWAVDHAVFRSVPSSFSAQSRDTGADVDQLILKRAPIGSNQEDSA
jgi:hypothetical protein